MRFVGSYSVRNVTCQFAAMTSQRLEILLRALMLFLFFVLLTSKSLSAVLNCLEFISMLLKNGIKILGPTLFGVLCGGKVLCLISSIQGKVPHFYS